MNDHSASAMAECEGYLEQDLAGRQPQEEDQGRQAAQVPAAHCCRSALSVSTQLSGDQQVK
jgi:hypothetical protein